MSVISNQTSEKAIIDVRKSHPLKGATDSPNFLSRRASSAFPSASPILKCAPKQINGRPHPLSTISSPPIPNQPPQKQPTENEMALSNQQQDINRISNTVDRVEMDMQSFKDFMIEVRQDLAAIRTSQESSHSAIAASQGHSSEQVQSLVADLKTVTHNLVELQNKATEVDALKAEVEHLRTRLKNVEDNHKDRLTNLEKNTGNETSRGNSAPSNSVRQRAISSAPMVKVWVYTYDRDVTTLDVIYPLFGLEWTGKDLDNGIKDLETYVNDNDQKNTEAARLFGSIKPVYDEEEVETDIEPMHSSLPRKRNHAEFASFSDGSDSESIEPTAKKGRFSDNSSHIRQSLPTTPRSRSLEITACEETSPILGRYNDKGEIETERTQFPALNPVDTVFPISEVAQIDAKVDGNGDHNSSTKPTNKGSRRKLRRRSTNKENEPPQPSTNTRASSHADLRNIGPDGIRRRKDGKPWGKRKSNTAPDVKRSDTAVPESVSGVLPSIESNGNFVDLTLDDEAAKEEGDEDEIGEIPPETNEN